MTNKPSEAVPPTLPAPTVNPNEPEASHFPTRAAPPPQGWPTAAQVKQQARTIGFHKVGIAAVEPELGRSSLQHWLEQGYQADMTWMANPRRQDVRHLLADVQAVICVALNYYTPTAHSDNPAHAKISRYGWGRDYHRIMHRRLRALATWLQAQSPNIQVRYYADTGPIQDKVWAQQAGLGWIAKNSNLITREYGSWVFLGEVLTNVPLAPDRPHPQHCGTCTRCLDACPTHAIVAPFVVDANRCIAYHTIENRAATLPPAIAAQLNGWVAGCDICQDVCPWNQRFAQETDIPDFQPYPWHVAPSLAELATLSTDEWERRLPASALRRIKPAMWRRNAAANLAPSDSPPISPQGSNNIPDPPGCSP